MTSKAFAKSMNTTLVNMLLSILERQWSTKLMKTVHDLAGSRNHRGSERGLHNTSPYNEMYYYLFIDGL